MRQTPRANLTPACSRSFIRVVELQGLAVIAFRLGVATSLALTVYVRAAASEDPEVASTAAGRELFREHCEKCHGSDGKGTPARTKFSQIPDFTRRAWHKQRKDADLAARIRNGKVAAMPAFKDKLSEEQVAKLVAYVRSFRGGAKAAKPPENDVEERFGRLEEQFHELQEESHELEEQSHESSKSARPSPEPGSDAKASSENSREPNAESRSPPMPDESSSPASAEETDEEKRFFTKLVGWLGKFHPMTVHFPIAMLVGAAVAELLLMVRDSPLLKSASRFCVWFGALTAVVAATLGWFLAGAHVSDPNWILTTHRWLGTSTVVCAAFVLFLSEVSRRGDRVARVGFRLALLLIVLLLMATGFFGGALIHPIDYYAWP